MSRATRASAVSLALAVAGLTLVATPSQAAAPATTRPAVTGQVVCKPGSVAGHDDHADHAGHSEPAGARAGGAARTGKLPRWRQVEDHTPITRADLEALPREETTRSFIAQEVQPVLPAIKTIPVAVHVIKGKHRGERVPAGPRKIRNIIAILNKAYSGGQSAEGAPTRYRFALKGIDYTKRDGWYHAFLYGPRDSKAKRKLHEGDAGTLNLYINGGPRDIPLLGWARFPWQYAAKPRLDGVTLTTAGLPGGRATGYNLGDTAVHEVGHWLGLLHTFQGGCDTSGDLVADTPEEAEPSLYCEVGRDTCPAPGTDPVRNFMDYSYDSCMNMFTAGQVRRMDAAFEKWRQ